MKVLVVSEDVKERQRATSALELHTELAVHEAVSAAEAHQRLLVDREDFDVLVVDGDLQPRGGYALLYDLRMDAELSGRPATPALVLYERDEDIWLARWAGASAWERKPVDPFRVAEVARELVGTEVPPYGDQGAVEDQLSAALRGLR